MNFLFPSSNARLQNEDCYEAVVYLTGRAGAVADSIKRADEMLGRLIAVAPASIGGHVSLVQKYLRGWSGLTGGLQTLLDVSSFETGEYKRMQADGEKLKLLPLSTRIFHAPDYAKLYLQKRAYLRRVRQGLRFRREILSAIAVGPVSIMRMVPGSYWIPLLASVPLEERLGLMGVLANMTGRSIDLRPGASDAQEANGFREFERLHENLLSMTAAVARERELMRQEAC